MAKTIRRNRKQDEELTNRILIVFGSSLAVLLLLMLLNRMMIADNFSYLISLTYGCGYAAAVSLAAAVAAVAGCAVIWKRSPGSPWLARLAHIGVITFLLAGMLGLIRYNNLDAFSLLYVFLISVAFLYLVFCIYQRDFFVLAVVTGCTSLVLYAFSRLLDGGRPPLALIGYAIATIVLVGALGLAYHLSRRKGVLGGITLLPHGTNYKLIYTTLLLMNVVLLVCLLLGATVSFWGMVGVLCYLFVLAVYYTVKLM